MEYAEGKVDYLKFQKKLNAILAVPLFLYSASKFSRNCTLVSMFIYQKITEIITIIVTLGEFWAVPHVYENMNVLCGCLASSAHSTQLVLKTFLLNFNKKRYLTHLERTFTLQNDIILFERMFFDKKETDFLEFYKKQSRYIYAIALAHLAINFASTSAYFLPFVYDSIINWNELDRQLTPIVVYVGIKMNVMPIFQIVIITLTLGFYIINLKTVVIDSFILNVIVFHVSQLKYQNNRLKDIKKYAFAEAKLGRILMAAWIKNHQTLLSLFNEFRQLVSPYLMLQFSYIFVHTSVPAFVITSTFSWTFAQKMAVFFMVGGGIVTLFLMCNAGDAFNDAWDDTRNILFEYNIVIKSNEWLKQVYLTMQKILHKPFRLNALGVFPLSCATFMTISRLIISYYMTLSQIQKMKRSEKS